MSPKRQFFFLINLFVALYYVSGYFENKTCFEELYPSVNIHIHQVAVKPNNFLVSNAVCRSLITSPVAV